MRLVGEVCVANFALSISDTMLVLCFTAECPSDCLAGPHRDGI